MLTRENVQMKTYLIQDFFWGGKWLYTPGTEWVKQKRYLWLIIQIMPYVNLNSNNIYSQAHIKSRSPQNIND